jgi:hypothetical protein
MSATNAAGPPDGASFIYYEEPAASLARINCVTINIGSKNAGI